MNRDVNIKSPYEKKVDDETGDQWLPVFPELNFIILKGEFRFIHLRNTVIYNYLDGQLTQESGHYAEVHYLFNNLIPNLSNHLFNIDLLNTWRTLYEVSYQYNISTQRSPLMHSSLLIKPINSQIKNPKYIFVLTLSVLLILILNFSVCILLAKRGRGCRKREYNCLTGHAQLNIEKPQQHGGSSPSSTNSNGTITQQLIVNTNCTTTTNSSLKKFINKKTCSNCIIIFFFFFIS
jgi:hypothetical protein